jgi:hypothetical protein
MTLKPFFISGCVAGLGLTFLIAQAGCSQPVEEPRPERAPSPVPAVEPEPAPPEPAPPEPAPSGAEPALGGEPDWKKLFAGYKAEFEQEFQPRRAGEVLQLKLGNGPRTVSGKLVAVEADQVLLEVSAGEMGYARSLLAPETRARLYGEDYAHLKATAKVRAEPAEYLREQERLAEAAREKAPASRPQRPESSGQASASIGRHSKPVVNPQDGSVLQVKEYLQANTRNPQSIRYVQWGKIQKHKEGFKVTCVYRVRSGEFGDSTESKYFFMDPRGRVLRTAAFRGVEVD